MILFMNCICLKCLYCRLIFYFCDFIVFFCFDDYVDDCNEVVLGC